MKNTVSGRRLLSLALGFIVVVTSGVAVCPCRAEPVSATQAEVAASVLLPRYFPGEWIHSTTRPLVDVDGVAAAYAVIFCRPDSPEKDTTPEAFVEKALPSIPESEKAMGSHASSLYGNKHFATVVTAASDSEPVLLRCHLGLPSQLVQQSFALERVQKANPNVTWRVGRLLFLGLFDDAVEIIPDAAAPRAKAATITAKPVVIDMRSGKTASLDEVREKKKQKNAVAPDPALVKACRKAWAKHPSKKPASVNLAAQPKKSRTKDTNLEVTDKRKGLIGGGKR